MTSVEAKPARPQAGLSAGLSRAWLLTVRATACALGVAVVWASAVMGAWFMPLVIGVLIGLLVRLRSGRGWPGLVAACLIGLGGWSLPLAWLVVRGEPVGATARSVAALAGLPPDGGIIVGATLLIAVLQAAAGVWAGRSLAGLACLRPVMRRRGRSRDRLEP